MRIPKATWLSCAAILSVAGLLTSSSDLLMASAVAAAAGLSGEAFYALRSRRQQETRQGTGQLHALERRLLVTENALASATQELSSLKEEREFVRQVRSADKTPDQSAPAQ